MTEAGRGLAQARRDLDDARFAASGERWNLACFLSQQAAEKALKAYLYAQGAEAVWGHPVAERCASVAAHDRPFAALGADAAALDQYYIPTRYPNGLPGDIPADVYTRADADRALGLCAGVIARIEATLAGRV
jgi:HEPN domain-containing protein